mmetsp:Transcript_30839/g.50188  ORF Transcript_30839/g.50188 Transcript_30839/m.50188 type:complete len:159 (-) Transcript_30839:182-658(-)
MVMRWMTRQKDVRNVPAEYLPNASKGNSLPFAWKPPAPRLATTIQPRRAQAAATSAPPLAKPTATIAAAVAKMVISRSRMISWVFGSARNALLGARLAARSKGARNATVTCGRQSGSLLKEYALPALSLAMAALENVRLTAAMARLVRLAVSLDGAHV